MNADNEETKKTETGSGKDEEAEPVASKQTDRQMTNRLGKHRETDTSPCILLC